MNISNVGEAIAETSNMVGSALLFEGLSLSALENPRVAVVVQS